MGQSSKATIKQHFLLSGAWELGKGMVEYNRSKVMSKRKDPDRWLGYKA